MFFAGWIYMTGVAHSQQLKLGFIATGPFRSLEMAAAKAAAQDASKVVGADIMLVPEDGGCTAEKTGNAIKGLKVAGVPAIVGSFCGGGIAAAAGLSRELEIPIVSLRPVTVGQLDQGFPWFFSEVERPDRWARGVGEEIERLGVKQVAILAWNNEYGKAGVEGLSLWEKRGRIRVASELAFPVGTADFGPYWPLTKKAEAVAFVSADDEAARAIRQAPAAKLDPKVWAVISVPSVGFFSDTKGIQRRIAFPITYPPDVAATKEFFARISRVEGESQFHQAAYRVKDVLDLLAIAYRKRAQWTPKALRDSLQALTPTPGDSYGKGLAGRIFIDAKSNEWLQEFYVGDWSKGVYRTAGGPKNHEHGP